MKFRQLFLEITDGMDVLKDSVTIAGVVMRIFRTKFLRENHLPIIPEGGYERAENQSKIAVKYFEWLAQSKRVRLRHACNGGEVEIGGLKVDCIIGAEKKIIEFQVGRISFPILFFAKGMCVSWMSKMFFALDHRTQWALYGRKFPTN